MYIDNWFIPMHRAPSSHLHVDMDLSASVHFTRAQLSKLRRQFFHPSAQKLFNLLRRTRPDDATPETLRILEDFSKQCDPIQLISTAPVSFRVSFGAEDV